jgi:hypothetical protein
MEIVKGKRPRAMLTVKEIEAVRQVINDKRDSLSPHYCVDGFQASKLISYIIEHLETRPLYPGRAKALYEVLDNDTRISFLQQIIGFKKKPMNSSKEVCISNVVEEGYNTLFNTILGTIEKNYGEELINYTKKQREEFQSASLQERKNIIQGLEEIAQKPINLFS